MSPSKRGRPAEQRRASVHAWRLFARSAATGHKAINRGPINVADYLLAFAKDRQRWRCNPILRERARYDRAYATWLCNPREELASWRFTSLVSAVRTHLGRAPTRSEVESHALAHPDHVVRFAQPRYDAVSRRAQALILRSRSEPDTVFRLERPGHPDLILRGGNRLLFLSRKVRQRPKGPALVEPLTNVWDDVPFQGLAKEGGVVFSRNKKPERLLARILAMSTSAGDWVMDPFLGSGTTAAVAQKMGRCWVGIENGDQAYSLCLPRLSRVVQGLDPTGVTRSSGWRGGGGFGVYA